MRVILCIAVAIAAIAAGGARADGLPVLGVDVGGSGVVVAGSPRYVALRGVGGGTLVARIERGSGKVLFSRLLPGELTIPAVAYDGSPGGLSRDGNTLVLITPRATFPRATTPLVVVDTPGLEVVRRVALRGDFSFDAVSPDGRWVYLIHYTSPTDPLRYEVRALAAGTGILAPRPVVDPHEPDEQMGGRPLTRASSADGRWAYTLYERPGNAPFVHALDTTGRTARCVDLDWLRDPKQLMAPRLVVDEAGAHLRVVSRGVTQAVIDTRTFAAAPLAQGTGASLPVWLVAGVAAAILLGLAAAVFLVAQRCPKWWARGSAVTRSGVAATWRASAERLSSSRTRMFRFRSNRS